MNAPLKGLHGCCSCRFILLLYQRTGGRARAVWTLWTWTSPWARSTRAWVCPALPYSQYLAQLSIFVRIPCLSSSAFHVIFFPCPHNGHLGIHPSWDRHSVVHCVKTLQGFSLCIWMYLLTGQGRAGRFVWSVKKSLPCITHAADLQHPIYL